MGSQLRGDRAGAHCCRGQLETRRVLSQPATTIKTTQTGLTAHETNGPGLKRTHHGRMALSASINNTFVHQMQRMMEWIDSDAQHLTKEEILDGIRVRVLVMVKKFIAFPHCHNFSLMQQPTDQST